MNNNSVNIDFSIIWKKIHASLTEQEEKLFHEWLAESKDHQEYFNKVKLYYQKGSQFENPSKISKEAWSTVSDKIQFYKPRRNNRFRIFATSIAASILLLLGVVSIFRPALFQKEVPLNADSSIVPGTEKAILLMDDGTSYNLSSGNGLSLVEGGTEISSKGNSLQYNSEKAVAKEVKYNTLVIPRGGQFNLTLADGTQVWLNAGSTLKYPTAFIGDDRQVELTGEAFFEVKRDVEKPFKVVSGEQVVQVLGTSFNISSYQEESSVYTTLVEGKVEVYLQNGPQDKKTLSPNQQSEWVKGNEIIRQRTVDVRQYIAWKDGLFYFKDKPLEKIMIELARWYDVEVKFANEEAKQLPFTGQIKKYEDLIDVLVILEKTGDVNFKIERRTITIK